MLAASVIALDGQAPISGPDDPWTLFQPQVTLSPVERARLEHGETLVKAVSPVAGQVAIFSAARTTVSGDRLIRWVHRVDAMKRGKYATSVVRFSDPPRLDDLASLTLEPDDLEAVRDCRPGSCDLKLSEAEMQLLVPLARSRRAGWQNDVQQAFRRVILTRAQEYLAGGFARTAPYRDRDRPVRLADEFQALMTHSAFLPQRLPGLGNFLTRYPTVPADGGIESFLYWSKEILGRKPVVSITHVTIDRPVDGPDAVVASRQVYATHYMSGSLAVTAIIGREGRPRYLAYLNRSRVDVLDGMFGGLVRRIVERRLRDEAGLIVEGLRTRLEGGEPPPSE